MPEAIDRDSRMRLEALGITDHDLLTYLLDRESGLYHFVAEERLCSGRDLTEVERRFISDTLRALPSLAPESPAAHN